MSANNYSYIEGLSADPKADSTPALKVIYEDNHVLVVFKPHRLLIQADHSSDATLFKQTCSWLKEKYQKPGNVYLGLVHRLDRPASGLVVFAKTSKAASRLSEQFREKSVSKTYHLLVEGKPLRETGKCIHYLTDPLEGRAEVFEKEQEGCKRAELNYRVVESKNGLSFVEVELVTGRRHQIRAQMSSLGHSLLGDGRYGSKTPFAEGSIALVAGAIAFSHPTKSERMKFELPLEYHSVKRFWNDN